MALKPYYHIEPFGHCWRLFRADWAVDSGSLIGVFYWVDGRWSMYAGDATHYLTREAAEAQLPLAETLDIMEALR